MKLISCEYCAVVLDQDKMNFPSMQDPDTGEIIPENTHWNGNYFKSKMKCPVCNNYIVKEE